MSLRDKKTGAMRRMATQDSTSFSRRARMSKIMIVAGCLLGLALACIPAYASPTNKKITLSCDITAGSDTITGYVNVTLCSSIDPTSLDPCVGPTTCPQVNCDSSGATYPISITVPCNASSKVGGVVIDLEATVTDSARNVVTGGSQPISTMNGKGYSLSVTPNPNDTLSLTVK
jgi:hypothetical protein